MTMLLLLVVAAAAAAAAAVVGRCSHWKITRHHDDPDFGDAY